MALVCRIAQQALENDLVVSVAITKLSYRAGVRLQVQSAKGEVETLEISCNYECPENCFDSIAEKIAFGLNILHDRDRETKKRNEQ